MNKFLKICGLAASLQFLGIQTLQAATLYIEPGTQSVISGSSVSVDVNVGELGGTQVGAYDFILAYDPGLLTFANLSFGSYLGFEFDSISEVADDSIAGELTVFEVSLLDPLLGQPSNFTLFSVTFNTSSSGIASLSLSGNIGGGQVNDPPYLGDSDGAPILLTNVSGASIEIQPRQDGSVPEPSSLLLMGLGWALLHRRSTMVSG